MRLVRFEVDGGSNVGVLEGETIREVEVPRLDADVPPIVRAATADELEYTGTEYRRAEVALEAPVARPGKIVCLGLNYREHAERGGNEIPESPLLFAKASSAITGPGDPIVYPTDVDQLDYEAELAVVVGRRGRRVSQDEAAAHVAGYTALNEVSARDVQYRYSQYFRGKSYDTFAPIGPAIATPEEFDHDGVSIRALVNGEVRQDSTVADMIFPVEKIVESVTQTMTLYPGDIIATGTPPGVGVHRDPPLLLEPGDEVTVEIEGIGALTNPVVAEE